MVLRDDVMHRLIFTLIETFFTTLCFYAAHKVSKIDAASHSIKIAKPVSFICLAFGLVIALGFYVEFIVYTLS